MARRRDAGLRDRIGLAAARDRLVETVSPHGRTERVPLENADGRVLAEGVTAGRDVPAYRRAAMDGFAVRAEDTFGAGDRSPVVLCPGEAAIGPGEAVRVHTGSALPEGADAVVMVEDTNPADDGIEVFRAVPPGENVSPVGEDVEAGQRLFEAGRRLRPSDLGLLKSVGRDAVTVTDRPTVGVIPTGSELVQGEPGPGETVETNGLTTARYVERWGGTAAYRDVVPDDREALASAIERDLERDLVVTTGGSSVGERDLVPDVVSELGTLLFHGVALSPGHPVAAGTVGDTPVLVLPGYPVSCIVTAVQLLRPALGRAGHPARPDGTPPDELPPARPFPAHPTVEARLDRKLASEPAVRTFARVRLEERAGERVAVPIRTGGASVLSSVALADGWVEVPERSEGIPAGERVAVQDWEWSP